MSRNFNLAGCLFNNTFPVENRLAKQTSLPALQVNSGRWVIPPPYQSSDIIVTSNGWQVGGPAHVSKLALRRPRSGPPYADHSSQFPSSSEQDLPQLPHFLFTQNSRQFFPILWIKRESSFTWILCSISVFLELHLLDVLAGNARWNSEICSRVIMLETCLDDAESHRHSPSARSVTTSLCLRGNQKTSELNGLLQCVTIHMSDPRGPNPSLSRPQCCWESLHTTLNHFETRQFKLSQ